MKTLPSLTRRPRKAQKIKGFRHYGDILGSPRIVQGLLIDPPEGSEALPGDLPDAENRMFSELIECQIMKNVTGVH